VTEHTPNIGEEKSALRVEAKRLRAGMHKMYGIEASEGAAKHAFHLLKGETTPAVVGLYWPIGDELDPRFLQIQLEQSGFKTTLPCITHKTDPLEFRLWGQGDPLIKGAYDILEPEKEAPKVVPDILIVPLLAYDERCYRLGWGGGFYDRTIAEYPHIRTFGFAYAAQIVNHVPNESHDLPLHGVITETGILFPKR
jgi:5-formyltetrahydrofolate cyclo-ligase